jgi:protoporphyrinogen oxidase
MSTKLESFDLIIVGAGPAGLTAAVEAQNLGKKVLILESDSQVGGISRTVHKDGYRFDLGGHRFFTKVRRVEDFWERVLPPEDFLDRPRKSRIFYKDKFYDYPLKPMNALFNLGVIESFRCIGSYVIARINPPKNQNNFEGWVTARFGWRLYSIFFKTYTEKVWGVPATSIQSDWAAQRIKNLSLSKAILNAFGFGRGKKDITTLIDTFKYPRLGPGMLWEKCAQIIEQQGGIIVLSNEVHKIQTESDGFIVRTADSSFKASSIISTLPINKLPEILGCDNQKVLSASKLLRHRDFLIVALVIDSKINFDDNWLYIHSSSVKIGRIQNFASWSPEMVIEGTNCLGLEYFVNEGDEIWNMPDDDLVKFASNELGSLNLVSTEKISRGFVVRVPKAYPVYDEMYKESLEIISNWISDECTALIPVGRNGMHRYNNQDHSMLTAMLAVENLFLNQNHDLWRVNVDNEYHEEIEDRNNSGGRSAPTYTNGKLDK